MDFINQINALIDFEIVIYISIASAMIIFLLLVDLSTTSIRVIRSAKYLIRMESEKLKKIDYQFSIIKTHAPTYINSLGKGGSDLLHELDTIIIEREETIAQLTEFIKDRDLEEIVHLLELEADKSKDFKWTQRAETLIRELGNKIYKASSFAHNAGLPKNKSKREPTRLSLAKAKIIPSFKDNME